MTAQPQLDAGVKTADIAIVGAGPAGLCMALALAGHGLRVTLLERQAAADLADAPFDGREIALTHASRATLTRLGVWQRLAPTDIHPLRDARVMDGHGIDATTERHALFIRAAQAGESQLGDLVPNHAIRRAAYQALQAVMQAAPDVTLIDQAQVTGFDVSAGDAATLRYRRGDANHTLRAKLVIAADSRFSEVRRMAGIGAQMHDFGRTMLVTRMTHEQPHDHVAWEWFGHGQTLALLPLNDTADGQHQAGAVLTLPRTDIDRLMALDDDAFGAEMTRRFESRLGEMKSGGTRHIWPLVAVYAHRFVGPRLALAGDAAVGMHPVTAHGFNLGLVSVELLSKQILAAQTAGQDVAHPQRLAAYERAHRLASGPLFAATQGIVALFTKDAPPLRWLRRTALRVAGALPPLQSAIARQLVQREVTQ